MSITSASPDRLGQFVDQVAPGRASTADDQRRAASHAVTVRDRCPDFGVDAASVHSLARVLDAMAATDAFVTTVRDELVAADGGAAASVVAVDDGRIAAALDLVGVGLPPAQVDLQPATGYGLPPTSGFVDDPICAANGNMIHQDLDLEFAGLAHALDVRRTYNSLRTHRVGAFGPGFTSILDVRVVSRDGASDGRIDVDLADGATAAFVRTPTGWGSAGRRLHALEQTDDGWLVLTDHRHGYRFGSGGQLLGWMSGVAEVGVTRDSAARIVGLREARTGRRVHIDWSDGRVAQVATDDGRRVTYTYGSGGRLVRATSAGGQLTYEWNAGLLSAVVDPDGVRPFVNEYDSDGRVVRQRSPFGRVTAYRYDGAGLTVITDDAGTRQAMVHDRRGNLTAVIDADGSAMRLTYDHADRVTRVVDRDGATWCYEFDAESGDLVRRIDPDGLHVEWAWDRNGRVVAATDRAGHTTHYSYPDDTPAVTTPTRVVDATGATTELDVDTSLDRPRSITDPDGVVTTFEYDTDGQLVAATDALGRQTLLAYDRAGRLLERIDPAGAVTRLDYDAAGRLSAYDRAGAAGTFTRTAAGRIVGGTEPGYASGERWTATLGEHGAPVAITDPYGNTVRLDYDELGDVVAITTADGATYHQFHDALGRPVGAVDPAGQTSHLRYDVAGRIVEAVDAAGRCYRRELDALGRTERSIAPDGAVTGWSYHPCGQIATVATPDGRVWSTTVDPAGRTTSVTDPAGHRTEFGYTPAGRMTERRSPGGAVERMEYDAAGCPAVAIGADGVRRVFERDPSGRLVAVDRGGIRDGFDRDVRGRVLAHRSSSPSGCTFREWEYDAAGNVTIARDGTGVTRQLRWDARGLLVGATDAAGCVLRYEYDARGRLVAQIAPGDRATRFRYGAAGYLNEVIDPAGATTRVDVDPTGLVVGQRCGEAGWTANLDPAGRVIARVDLTGVVLARLGYDDAGRLVTAGADGVVERFVWDRADHLIASTLRSTAGDVTSLAERDADGWALAGAAAAHPGEGSRDLAGRLLVGRDGSAYHYDGAGRLARIESADGADTTFEYDVDGLVSVERGANGVRHFRYDVAGRVAAITTDGRGTTTFDYDAAGRRIGEHRPDGSHLGFEWSGLSRLSAIVVTSPAGVETRITVVADAFGRPVRVGDHEISYDPVSGLPVARDGAHVTGPTRAGLRVGDLTFLGARVHDATTNQFLSPDPLLALPGSPGAASAYTYAWHDPVNHVDPSGKRPIGIDEWEAIRTREERGRLGEVVAAIDEDPWGTIAMAGVLAAGVALTAIGVGAVGVPLLLGMGLAAGVGLATGTFNPRDVAIGGIMGAAGGVVASSLRVGAISLQSAVVRQGGLGAMGELGGRAASGEGIDLHEGLVAGVLSAATLGVGERFAPGSIAQGFVLGAGVEGGAHVTARVLSGDPIDPREALLEAGFGGLGGAADVSLGAAHAHGDAAFALGAGTTVHRATSWADQQVFAETGLVPTDARPRRPDAADEHADSGP